MLNTLKINSLPPKAKSYRLADGGGLFLQINPSNSKCWTFRYRFGTEKSISLGKYPEVGLKEAREEHLKAVALLKQNIDPSTNRRQQKLAVIRQHANTFGSIAREWYEANHCQWTPRHAKKLWRVIELHLLPHLKKEPIAQLKPRDILEVLRKIEAKGATETSRRALWITRRIFDYAIAIDAAELNPAQNIGAGLKPHVAAGHPCIELSELPAFLSKLERVQARLQDKLALRLLLFTVLRTGELRRCKWRYVSLVAAEIRLPKEVMKMRDDHIVPLSRQAIGALLELHALTGHQEWLFPNTRCGKHPIMNENVVNELIADMHYKGRMCGHSVRKLFSTVLNEQEFNSDAIERQLAHAERRKSRAAYNYAKHLQTRRFLMQWWADYLDSLTTSKAADSGLELGHFPRGSTMAEFDGRGMEPRFHPPIPSAFAYSDDCGNLDPTHRRLLN